jgi:hypothetical protein
MLERLKAPVALLNNPAGRGALKQTSRSCPPIHPPLVSSNSAFRRVHVPGHEAITVNTVIEVLPPEVKDVLHLGDSNMCQSSENGPVTNCQAKCALDNGLH